MNSASTPQSHRSSDAGNSSPRCRSYVQKSVCLQDWWLIKPETDDNKKRLGVGGVTCPSQESRAERTFYSAPILKAYDFFELETVDGVGVILQGLINQDRTIESGFSFEVFNHFIIGFPPYWEEFATNCPETGSVTGCVSGANNNANLVHEEGKDSTQGHQDVHDNTRGKSRHSDTLDIGVQDSEDTYLSNKTSTDCNESSLEVPNEHITKDGHEVPCERSPLISAFEDNPTLMTSPIDVHSMKHVVLRSPLSKNFRTDAVNSSSISKCSEVSRRRVTRSMKKMDNSKNHSAQGSLVHNTSSLDKNDALSNRKAVNVVDCGETKLLHVGASSFPSAAEEVANIYSSSLGDKFDTVELPVNSVDDTAAQRLVFSSLEQNENCELQNSRRCQEGISSSSCGVKCKSRKNISTSEKTPDEQSLKNPSTNLSVGYGKGSHEVASYSEGMVLGIKSKGKQDDQYVIDVTKYQRNTSSSQVGTVGGGVVDASTENFNFASSVLDINEREVLSRSSTKACRNKKRNIAAKSKSRVDVPDPDKEDDLNAAVAKQGIASKEASMTGNKSTRKLTFGSSQREISKRQHITNPKSAKYTSRLAVPHPTETTPEKGSEERYGSANILSPESLSSKRSRSGRLLLPTLEFWRNQTAVYDADRQVTGVRDGTYLAQSPRDNKTF